MSRRKQTRPQHWHSDSDTEDGPRKERADYQLNAPPKSYSADTTTTSTTATTISISATTTTSTPAAFAPNGDQQKQETSVPADADITPLSLRRKSDTETLSRGPPKQTKDKKNVTSNTDPNTYHEGVASVSIITATPPKKRGRPPSLHLQKQHTTVVPASVTTLSPRRQSLRLQQTQSQASVTTNIQGKKMSHRTCQYCGVVKPTPAALQRHLRKHTGERPFICQVCNKAYKAKRSLHLHQLSYHQEIFDSKNGLDLSGASPATISASTTNLLRETLESRRLARISVGTDSDDVACSGSIVVHDGNEEDSTEAEEQSRKANISAGHMLSPLLNDLASKDQSMDNRASSLEESEREGEETSDDPAKRSCPYCFKVCLKPSDMKRHLMVHTGERPFLCQVCQKQFKQKGSLLYHQKAAHNLDVELSQGLEERYLRLKTRSAMRTLAAMDGLAHLSGQDSGTALPLLSASGTVAGTDTKHEASESKSDQHFCLPPHTSKHKTACSVNNSDFRQGLSRQISHTSDGSWPEDHGGTANIVEVDIPGGLVDGDLSLKESGQQMKIQVAVHKESVVLTRLDGFCLNTRVETMLFRCYICGKICASLYHVFSHLTAHFNPKVTTFDCRICQAVFKSQPEMADHLHSQHNLNPKDLDLDLSSNGNLGVQCSSDGEKNNENVMKFKHPGKTLAGFDDHNNNNDNHIDKETTVAHGKQPAMPESASAKDTEAGEGCSSDLDAADKEFARSTFGTHSCTICRKGFTSQYLLMRHMHLHKQQMAIEAVKAAVYSGTTTNGFHQELLLKPPAVLPQNSEVVDLEIEAFVKGKDPVIEKSKCEKVKADPEKEIVQEGQCQDGEKMAESGADIDSAKALLEKEGFKEDITVVLPSDPEMDKDSGPSSPRAAESRSEVKVKEQMEAEIRSAPKRSLMSFRKEGPPTKSRRKALLPTRFNHEALTLAGSKLLSAHTPPQSSLSPPSQQQITSATPPPTAKPEQASASPPLQNSDNSSIARAKSPQVSEDASSKIKPLVEEEILARQSKYVQQLHAAFGTLPPSLFTNGFPPPASLAMATAGLFGPLVGPPFPTLPAVGLHGPAASSTPLHGASTSPVSHASNSAGGGGGVEQLQAEDLSLSSSSLVSPNHPVTPSHLAASPTASSPTNDRDSLVGYPRVLWPKSGGSRSSRDTPSPSSQHSPPPSSSANGKRMTPIWHTLTSEDMGNVPPTDGRKVTSLSRTHSRLYVVNQPVDREQLCKPTVLPDGRTVYRCVFCHKDFLSYSDINRHMDFHEDIRPYKCNFCDYYARTNSQLKVHMMRHQGIREYCCRLCNYKGVTQSDLNRHMKSQIHLLKSRNECKCCGEGFVTSKNLEKHISAGCTGRHKMDMEDD